MESYKKKKKREGQMKQSQGEQVFLGWTVKGHVQNFNLKDQRGGTIPREKHDQKESHGNKKTTGKPEI